MTSYPIIRIPSRLGALIDNSQYKSGVDALVQHVSTILALRSPPFFPAYTDHGVNHINDVLISIEDLIPHEVWDHKRPNSEKSLLSASDAAVIIGSTLLHDLAMFLHINGFRNLIEPTSSFKPLPWFDRQQDSKPQDRSWCDLWKDYEKEVRCLGEKRLSDIIGVQSARTWTYRGLPDNAGEWTESLRLIVGEFLRRHHPRLAHEIAIYGFPGLQDAAPAMKFPCLSSVHHTFSELENLIGLTARSHGMDLRVCIEYLESELDFRHDHRPYDCSVLYSMALLRVADYLQLDKRRAPAMLLHLIDPQSDISVNEWNNHAAITNIDSGVDPTSLFIRVEPGVSLRQYLQLEALIIGLQREIDHSAAVLSEFYGPKSHIGLDKLKLGKTRVRSNIFTTTFRNNLPYVPERTGFSVDPNVIPLLVRPLYEEKPSIAFREVVQNAVDAVRELVIFCADRGWDPSSIGLNCVNRNADVACEFIEQEPNKWILRVTDRGIGMRADTLRDYFLRAGASFRNSIDWSQMFLDEKGQAKITRTGSFGIGVFSVFLLGSCFKLWTRNVNESPSNGYYIEATDESTLIEIHRTKGLPVGTTLEIAISRETIQLLLGWEFENKELSEITKHLSWYCWDWPKIAISLQRSGHPCQYLPERNNWPLIAAADDPHINLITENEIPVLASYFRNPDELTPADNAMGRDPKRIAWSFKDCDLPPLSVNGFHVDDSPDYRNSWGDIGWNKFSSLEQPYITIDDPHNAIPLTIRRDRLLKCEKRLMQLTQADMFFSQIAHAMLCGPDSLEKIGVNSKYHPSVRVPDACHPLEYEHVGPRSNIFSRWIGNCSGFVPFDPYTISIFGSPIVRMFGVLSRGRRGRHTPHARDRFDFSSFIQRFPGRAPVGFLDGQVSQFYCRRGGNDHPDFPSTVDLLVKLLSCGGTISLRSLYLSVNSSQRVTRNQEGRDIDNIGAWGNEDGWEFAAIVNEHTDRREAVDTLVKWCQHVLGHDNRSRIESDDERVRQPIVFVADIRVPSSQTTKTPFGLIWDYSVGHHAIPFDSVSRNSLIEGALGRSLLSQHVRRWQQIAAMVLADGHRSDS